MTNSTAVCLDMESFLSLLMIVGRLEGIVEAHRLFGDPPKEEGEARQTVLMGILEEVAVTISSTIKAAPLASEQAARLTLMESAIRHMASDLADIAARIEGDLDVDDRDVTEIKQNILNTRKRALAAIG